MKLTSLFRLSASKKGFQKQFLRSNAPLNQTPLNVKGDDLLTSKKGQEDHNYFMNLRIYKESSWRELINLLMMTTVCSNDFFVDNCHRFYSVGKKTFGPTFTDYTIANTIGRIFTGGDTFHTMEKFVKEWKYPTVGIIIGYNNEIAPGQAAPLEELDNSAQVFSDTADAAALNTQVRNRIAIKCSCLCPPDVTKKANEAQLKLRAIFSKSYNNLDQTLTAREIMNKFSELKMEFTFEEFREFMKTFLNKEVYQEKLDEVTVTKFEWLRDIHMFYVQDPQKSTNKILKQITGFSENDLIELDRFSQRLKLVFERVYQKGVSCFMDAEQSYYQETFDSFAMQYSSVYNKERATILNTFQNYLKVTTDKLVFEVKRCKSLNIRLGAKMVRGAYMVEERALASRYNYEDPICPTIEDTHNNYNSNLEFIFSNWIQGSSVVIASHNQHSVNLGKELIKKYDMNSSKGFVGFAQLLGLGDHLTFSLRDQGYSVAKNVVFGPTPILIPFFIRRAQETKQMMKTTRFQHTLVLDEIFRRLSFRN